MVDEWWVAAGPSESKGEAPEPTHPPLPTHPIRSRPLSSRWSFEETLAEELMAPHYARLKIMIIAPFAIVLSSFFTSGAGILLVLPYLLYIFYSVINAVYRLRGTAFKWGLIMPIFLSIPATVSAARYFALYDGCVGIGGWVCRDDTNYGPSFNPLLLALPFVGGLAFLPSMSELRQGTLLLGMLYGFFLSVVVFLAAILGGIALMFS